MNHDCPAQKLLRNTAKKLYFVRQIFWDGLERNSCELCTDNHPVLQCPFVLYMSQHFCHCKSCFEINIECGTKCTTCAQNCSDIKVVKKEICHSLDLKPILTMLRSKTCCNTSDFCQKFIVRKEDSIRLSSFLTCPEEDKVGDNNSFCGHCSQQFNKYLRCYFLSKESKGVPVSDVIIGLQSSFSLFKNQDDDDDFAEWNV